MKKTPKPSPTALELCLRGIVLCGVLRGMDSEEIADAVRETLDKATRLKATLDGAAQAVETHVNETKGTRDA